jgi:hypothetical protein
MCVRFSGPGFGARREKRGQSLDDIRKRQKPATIRSVSALLAALEKEGVKLTAEPAGKAENNAMGARVRTFTVAHELKLPARSRRSSR